MGKKLIVFVGVAVMLFSFSISALAADIPAAAPRGGYGCGRAGACYGLMWDDDGNFLGREAFEERLDQGIEDGQIDAGDRQAFLAQYDYCAENGGGIGCGRGMRRGRWAS